MFTLIFQQGLSRSKFRGKRSGSYLHIKETNVADSFNLV